MISPFAIPFFTHLGSSQAILLGDITQIRNAIFVALMNFSELVIWGMRQSSPRPSGLPSRLQRLADLAGSVLALSEIAGVSRKALGEWLSGKREPSSYGLRKIVDGLGVDQEWLLTGVGPEPRSISSGVVKTAAIPLTDRFSENKSIISADVDWLRIHLGLRSDNTLLLHAQDDELAPTICRGEPVLARDGGHPGQAWRLFAIRFFDSGPVVRYVKSEDNGTFTVRTENTESTRHFLGDADGFLILGEVVWFGTKVLPYPTVKPRSQSVAGLAPMRRRVP